MNLPQFLLILRARLRVILLALGVTVAASIAVSLLLPKSYEATTTLVVNYKGSDPVTGSVMPAQLMLGYLATQVDVIQSKSVAMAVVDTLKLAEIPSVKEDFIEATEGAGDIRDWLGGLLLKNLAVVPSRESSVLTLTFTGSDPQFAATVVNAFASEYQKMSVQLKVQPLKQASRYFNEQTKELRDKLEVAQSNLSKYQQDNGLVSVDNRLDVESARLNELSTQLVIVQGQLMEANSRQRGAQGNDAAESPDVVGNPLVQNLKSSVAQAEARLSQAAERLGQNHPTYQAAKAEVDKLRAELASHIKVTSNSVGNSARILQRRESELRLALDAQKTKVLELNRARDELAVLVREVDSAQRAYDATLQRFNQTNMEGSSNQADVAVLSPALAPIKPSGPKILLNTLISIFIGTFFGVGLAVLAELLDRRVRSAADVSDLNIPLLCELEFNKKTGRGESILNLIFMRRKQAF